MPVFGCVRFFLYQTLDLSQDEEIQGEKEGGYKKWLKLNAQQKLELMRESYLIALLSDYYIRSNRLLH